MQNTQNMQKMKNGEQTTAAGWIISGVAIESGIALAYAASRKKRNWRDRLMDTAGTVARRSGGIREKHRRPDPDYLRGEPQGDGGSVGVVGAWAQACPLVVSFSVDLESANVLEVPSECNPYTTSSPIPG